MEIGAGLTCLTEGLPTRWRPLYDDYGPALGSGARIPPQGARPGPEMTNCPTIATTLNECLAGPISGLRFRQTSPLDTPINTESIPL